MAMPENQTSSEPVPAAIVGARALGITDTVDYEDGGIGLNDPSEGLLYQQWRGRLLDGDIILDAPNTEPVTIYTATGATEFSFTFDQNMRPVASFVIDGVAYLRWYDSSVPGTVVTTIGSGVISPKVFLDDKRPLALANSDVILGYIRDGFLRTRIQRDRFLIEYTHDAVDTRLIKIGFNAQLRVQFIIANG